MSCPPTRVLRLTPLLVCSYPLQKGRTPLHEASLHNCWGTAEVLLKHKADVNAQNEVGEAWWWVRGACAVDCMLTEGFRVGVWFGMTMAVENDVRDPTCVPTIMA